MPAVLADAGVDNCVTSITDMPVTKSNDAREDVRPTTATQLSPRRTCSQSVVQSLAGSSRHFTFPIVVKFNTDTGDNQRLAGREIRRPKRRKRARVDSDGDKKDCRKWKSVPLHQTGFDLSLLPRRHPSTCLDYVVDQTTEQDGSTTTESNAAEVVESNTHPETCASFISADGQNLAVTDISCKSATATGNGSGDAETERVVSLECYPLCYCSDESDHDDHCGPHETAMEESANNRPVRCKKKWSTEKARRQVKTRHCRNVVNVAHGVTLYVNHRVLKRMSMTVQPTSHRPCSVTLCRIDKKALLLDDRCKRQSLVTSKQSDSGSRHPVHPVGVRRQMSESSRLLYAIDVYNADSLLPTEVASLMVALQHRDLDPNDYELLLLLDDSVGPRTVDESQLAALPVEELSSSDLCENIVCGVCLEPFESGQRRKHLHCGHSFHDICIDGWLRHSSTKCPLDNLEVFV